MKRNCMAVICLALCTALLAGCAVLDETEIDWSRLLSRQSTPGQVYVDPLTGGEVVWPGQRPVAVTIENATGNATQWGIGSASVVLEALTSTGTDTSLCLVYPSVQAMPRVGPVAAGQDLYWRLLSGQQVIPVQRGGGTFDENYLDYYSIRAVDAMETGVNAFSCADTWSNNPLWYTSGVAVNSVLEGLNISAALTESRVTHSVTADGTQAASDAEADTVLAVPSLLPQSTQTHMTEATVEDATGIVLRFDDSNATGFAYDASAGGYKMLRGSGVVQVDANTGKQAVFDGLLVLYSTPSTRDDGVTLDYDLTMGGGVWFSGGQLWNITWTQGASSTLAIYDADGKALTLPAGRTYVALVASLTGQELTVTSSTGSNVLGG